MLHINLIALIDAVIAVRHLADRPAIASHSRLSQSGLSGSSGSSGMASLLPQPLRLQLHGQPREERQERQRVVVLEHAQLALEQLQLEQRPALQLERQQPVGLVLERQERCLGQQRQRADRQEQLWQQHQ